MTLMSGMQRLTQLIHSVDNRISVELYLDPSVGDILYSRTIFENHPDPMKRPRMMSWTYKQLDERGLIRGVQDPIDMIAYFIVDFWANRRRLSDAKLNACDCKLVAGHETWCHKWEAY